MNKNLLAYAALALGLAVAPLFGGYPIFLMKLMCYALFASAFNLLLGYTGILSFGHAAFFGVAGYATGHALKMWGLPTEIGVLFGVLTAAITGLIIGWFTIRRSGIYATMITLAFAQMLFFVFLQASFTGGEDGLQGIPRGHFLGLINLKNDLALYYVVLGVFMAALLAIWRTVHSPFGQVLKAIRENEPRAISLGYNANHYKLIAFIISATLAGLAGSLKSIVFVSATLSDAMWQMSGLVVLMTLVGGLGTLSGPILGAFLVVVLESKIGDIGHFIGDSTGISWFYGLGESVSIVIGLIFILCVMTFRRGILGELFHFINNKRNASQQP